MKYRWRSLNVAAVVTLIIVTMTVCRAAQGPRGESLVYIGTYTSQSGPSQSKGIYVSRFRTDTGEGSDPVLAAETDNPSFLAIHPSRRFLYSTNETGARSSVSSFAIEPATGKLTLLNRVASGGQGPCQISVDRTGNYLLVANFVSGNAAVLRLKGDGSLGEQTALVQQSGSSVNPQWQSGPHAHWAGFSPDDRFAIVANIGNDQMFVYRFDAANGSLAPNDPSSVKMKPGYGPRHFTFHPNGKFGYLLNQLSGALIVFGWDADRGVLNQIQDINVLPTGFTEEFNSAEVAVDPRGRFIYASTRGPDTIAVFSVDPVKGTVALIQQVPSRGMSPRHFALDPTGSYLLVANQYTDGVVILAVDSQTGRLKRTRRMLKVNAPVCVKFVTLN